MRRCSISLVIRETQIKTTMRYHFMPTRMARIKKVGSKKCQRGCGEIRSLTYCCGKQKCCSHTRKTSPSALLTMPKTLTAWITTNCGKFFKRWEFQTTLPASWEICMQVKKQQLEPDIQQQTGSKLGKEYVKAIYCHLAYLTHIQSTSCKTPAWTKHKLESRLPGAISITSDKQMTPSLRQKVKSN